jgi:hypothetical protein
MVDWKWRKIEWNWKLCVDTLPRVHFRTSFLISLHFSFSNHWICCGENWREQCGSNEIPRKAYKLRGFVRATVKKKSAVSFKNWNKRSACHSGWWAGGMSQWQYEWRCFFFLIAEMNIHSRGGPKKTVTWSKLQISGRSEINCCYGCWTLVFLT